MAYKLDTQRIVPGGLNLLQPGDAVGEGDCLDLQGWWPGAAGRLEQAPAAVLRSAVTVPVFPVSDSLCQASGRIYYGASGAGTLRQIGRAAEVPINSDYDHNPLGLLSYQGFCWIMNQAHQRKDDGTASTAWTPAAPNLPTLTNPALTSATLAVAECDPVNPDSNGDFQQINMYTSASIAGLDVGALVTIAGIGAGTSFAMNGTWLVTAIFAGSPNLIQLQASPPAGTVFTVAGGITFTWANPGMPTGDYNYYITWQYTELGESNPSSAGTPRIVTATPITVPNPGTYVDIDISALTPPAGASGWNIYRQGNQLPSAYRLNENTLDLTRTFVYDYGDDIHTHSDAQLLSLGILMEADHDPAPACKVIAQQVYNGRMVVANSIANPNRVWYSPALQPGFFRGSGNPNQGDWVDIGTDRGDEILAMTVRPGIVVVYRARSIWRILGDFGDPNSRIEPVVPDQGAAGVRSVVSTSLGDYFISNDGVYKFNNDWAQKVSAKVEPVFRGIDGEYLSGADPATRGKSAIGYRNGRLWVSWGANATTLIYHIDTQRWFDTSEAYFAYLDAGADFLGAGFGVSALENNYAASSQLGFQSAYQDCGLPDHEKTFADLVVHHNTRGQILTVYARVNKGWNVGEITLGTIQSTVLIKQIIPLVDLAGLPIRVYNLAVRIAGVVPAGTDPILIDTPLLLHYYLEARRAKAFDSDETSHGAQGVKEVDQVEFDVDATDGGAMLTVYSDIPGGAMTVRAGAAIAQTTGRQVRRLVLAAPVDGNLLRYTVLTLSDFQVYAARARVLPIGVYLDGTVGDFWQCQPISVGV